MIHAPRYFRQCIMGVFHINITKFGAEFMGHMEMSIYALCKPGFIMDRYG
jgi:hypothetical protein